MEEVNLDADVVGAGVGPDVDMMDTVGINNPPVHLLEDEPVIKGLIVACGNAGRSMEESAKELCLRIHDLELALDGKLPKGEQISCFIMKHVGISKGALSSLRQNFVTMNVLTLASVEIPKAISVLRPLGRKKIAKDSELTVTLYKAAVELAGDGDPTEAIVKDAVDTHFGLPPKKDAVKKPCPECEVLRLRIVELEAQLAAKAKPGKAKAAPKSVKIGTVYGGVEVIDKADQIGGYKAAMVRCLGCGGDEPRKLQDLGGEPKKCEACVNSDKNNDVATGSL